MERTLKLEDFEQDKLQEKGLILNGELSDKFYNAYEVYYNRLIKYLSYMFYLYQYNIDIQKLNLPIMKKENNVSFNKELSPFKFTYIDSALHIERLTPQVIDFLNDVHVKDLAVQRVEFDRFIQQTYKEVVRENNVSEIKLGVSYDLNPARFNLPEHVGENIDDLFDRYKAQVDVICQNIVSRAKELNIPLVVNNYGCDETTIGAVKEAAKGYENIKSM